MKKAPAVRTRHPKATTRATILAKAYEMYRDRELVHGDERLSHVLDELGYTTGAGYQIWANQAAFRQDLQIYVAENITHASPTLLDEDIQRVLQTSKSFEEVTLRVGDLYVEGMIGLDEFYITLRFFGMADDRPAEITEALSDAYERSGWETGPRLEGSLQNAGRKIRDPFTVDDLVMAVTALLEGYAIRAAVQKDRVLRKVEFAGGSHYAFSVGFLALINQYSERVEK